MIKWKHNNMKALYILSWLSLKWLSKLWGGMEMKNILTALVLVAVGLFMVACEETPVEES